LYGVDRPLSGRQSNRRRNGSNAERATSTSVKRILDAISQTRSRTIYLEDQDLVNTLNMAKHPPITEAL
jgi:hypothetical protein